MKFNKLGNTSTEVSRICLGTMTWGDQNTKKQAHEQLDYAIKEARINFIDTAELYAIPPKAETCGKTEEYIGDWLQKNPSLRDEIVIASKMVGP